MLPTAPPRRDAPPRNAVPGEMGPMPERLFSLPPVIGDGPAAGDDPGGGGGAVGVTAHAVGDGVQGRLGEPGVLVPAPHGTRVGGGAPARDERGAESTEVQIQLPCLSRGGCGCGRARGYGSTGSWSSLPRSRRLRRMLGVLTPGIADGAGRSLRRRRDVAGPVAPLTYSAARPPRPSPPSCCARPYSAARPMRLPAPLVRARARPVNCPVSQAP